MRERNWTSPSSSNHSCLSSLNRACPTSSMSVSIQRIRANIDISHLVRHRQPEGSRPADRQSHSRSSQRLRRQSPRRPSSKRGVVKFAPTSRPSKNSPSTAPSPSSSHHRPDSAKIEWVEEAYRATDKPHAAGWPTFLRRFPTAVDSKRRLVESAKRSKVFLNLANLLDLGLDQTMESPVEVAARDQQLASDGFEGVQLVDEVPLAANSPLPHCGLDRINLPQEADPIAASTARGDIYHRACRLGN